jgi:FMN reductase
VTNRTVVAVTAGLTQPSSTRLLTDRLVAATRSALADVGIQARTQTIELRQHGRDVMNSLLTGFAPAGLREVVDAVGGADGLIAVTPIFNASYSGLFKSFFDILEADALADRPVLIAATGGTARHTLALEHMVRPLFVYLHAAVVPTSVYAASEDWAGGPDPDGGSPRRAPDGASPQPAPLHRRIDRAARELAASMSQREPRTAVDPFALTTPFEDLIAGS